ncbi:MAG TPA: hypothetical protein VKE96_29250, partial [Vicinamibacterales bacterium]|nr:hypothetical protein [Vicinamibacterales bacterium]
RGIDVEALGPTGAGLGQTALDVKITGNDVNPNDTTGFPLYAIYVGADAQGSGTSGSNVHAEIHGNTVPTSSACDTQCSGSTTGMIFYETVDTSGQPLQGTKTGTLFQTGAGGGVSNEIATTNTGTAGKTCSFLNGGTLTLSATPPVTVARLSMPHLVPAAAMAHSVFAAGRSGAPALTIVAFIAVPARRWWRVV